MRDNGSGSWSPTRRQVLAAGGLGAAVGIVGSGGAASAADVISKPVPGTGQSLPAIGLGTFMTLDTLPGAATGHLREVVRRFWQGGGRVVDVSPLYGRSEQNLGDIAGELGVADRLFVTDKVWSTGEHLWDDSHAEAVRRQSMRRLKRREPIDVLQCHSLVNVDVVVPLLHAWKAEGRVRRIGVSHHDPAYFDIMAGWVRRADLDFVQVHYSIHTRDAERRVFPAAAEQGAAVLVNMPLEKARLHAVVAGRPLPAFAADLGIQTWAQYFLKWVISHPTVTCAISATSNPHHVAENLTAMRGPLPDPDTRERMVRHMEAIPGFDRVGTMPWYPGKSYQGLVSRGQARLRARSPWWPS